MKKKIIIVIMVIICIFWFGFIANNTSQIGEISNDKSISIVESILNKSEQFISNKIVDSELINEEQFLGYNKQIVIRKLNALIRKLAHAFEFLILAILLYTIFTLFKLINREVIIYSLFIVLLYAVIDEFRQLYILGRFSNVKDVIIDFIGGVIGITISYITAKLSKNIYKVFR